MFILKRDSKEIMRGETEYECLKFLHQFSPCSWDYNFKYGGYSLESETETEKEELND